MREHTQEMRSVSRLRVEIISTIKLIVSPAMTSRMQHELIFKGGGQGH